MDYSTSGLPVLYYLTSHELVVLSNHLIFCCPLLLPSIFPSIRVVPSESVLCIRWPKYRSFSFSMSFQWIALLSIREKKKLFLRIYKRIFFMTLWLAKLSLTVTQMHTHNCTLTIDKLVSLKMNKFCSLKVIMKNSQAIA